MRLEDFDVRKKISKGAFGDGRRQLIIDFDLDLLSLPGKVRWTPRFLDSIKRYHSLTHFTCSILLLSK
jgi:hypothetical protein